MIDIAQFSVLDNLKNITGFRSALHVLKRISNHKSTPDSLYCIFPSQSNKMSQNRIKKFVSTLLYSCFLCYPCAKESEKHMYYLLLLSVVAASLNSIALNKAKINKNELFKFNLFGAIVWCVVLFALNAGKMAAIIFSRLQRQRRFAFRISERVDVQGKTFGKTKNRYPARRMRHLYHRYLIKNTEE